MDSSTSFGAVGGIKMFNYILQHTILFRKDKNKLLSSNLTLKKNPICLIQTSTKMDRAKSGGCPRDNKSRAVGKSEIPPAPPPPVPTALRSATS